MWANGGIRMSLTNFRANIDARPFADVTCRKLCLHYGEHEYRCLTGLYFVNMYLNLEKGSSLGNMVSMWLFESVSEDEDFVGF